MTNAELIQKIRAEIERRITDNIFEAKLELIDILAWLDTLESEKPMNQDELEKEINRYLEPIHTADIQFEPFTQMTKCARHFAQWQYQKDRGKFAQIKAKTWSEGFDACKDQMLKEAVEGKIGDLGFHNAVYLQEQKWTNILDGFKKGDKVRIIIVKEDEK